MGTTADDVKSRVIRNSGAIGLGTLSLVDYQISVPTTPDERYWESLERAMAFTVPRPSILIVNYPSNPTAETVDLAFYERLVAWARENKVWILSDLAYSELYFSDRLWPDFDEAALDEAISAYGARERRFGKTSEQIQAARSA